MNSERATGDGRTHDNTKRFSSWIPIAGYVLAQVVAVGGWGIVVLLAGWSGLSPVEWFDRHGVSVGTTVRNELRDVLFVTALFAAPLAILYGVFDGVLRAVNPVDQAPRVVVAAGLVLLTLLWILPNGLFWASSARDFYDMRPIDPLIAHWLGGLAGIEVALVAELVVATVFWLIGRLFVRLYKRRRHG